MFNDNDKTEREIGTVHGHGIEITIGVISHIFQSES